MIQSSSLRKFSTHRSSVSFRCSPNLGPGIIFLLAGVSAQADDYIVYSPYVLATQSEIELRGYQYEDSRAVFTGGSAAEFSVSHAFTDWWKPEIYLVRFQKDPGSAGRLLGYEFENTFQFTQPGEFWVDLGFLASYEHQIVAGMSDVVEFGPLLEKRTGKLTYKVNFIWEKEVGANASDKYMFRSSYSGTYTINTAFRPGVEAYARPNDRAYQVGPIAAGEWHVPGTTSSLEYRVGVMLGVNDAAPRQTWLAQFEYEFF